MNQAGTALGRIGSTEAKNTYAMRLEKAWNTLERHIERLENALSRVHGTPPNAKPEKSEGQITPVVPVSISIERIEGQVRKFSELVASVEEIA